MKFVQMKIFYLIMLLINLFLLHVAYNGHNIEDMIVFGVCAIIFNTDFHHE